MRRRFASQNRALTNLGSNLSFLIINKNKADGLFLFMAEARGFEPPNAFRHYTRSRRAPSTTRTHFRLSINYSIDGLKTILLVQWFQSRYF